MNRTATHFGSKATEARIATRVRGDYTPEAWAADKASQRTHTGQEATVTHAIKCGNCKGTHQTASIVRDCYASKTTATQVEAFAQFAKENTPEPVAAGRDTFNDDWAAMKNEAAQREAQQERAAYEAKARRDDTPAVATVPAGRYAVTGEDGATKFYRVDRPTEGKWKGYTFVKVQAGDELHNLRGRQARDGVLRKIAEAGVQAAMERYGREIGACGHCGRTLTNEASIERGIGPVCAGKMGW